LPDVVYKNYSTVIQKRVISKEGSAYELSLSVQATAGGFS